MVIESCNQNTITEILASGKDSSWLQAWRTTSATLDSFDMTEAQKNGEVNTDPATVELAWLVFEPGGGRGGVRGKQIGRTSEGSFSAVLTSIFC